MSRNTLKKIGKSFLALLTVLALVAATTGPADCVKADERGVDASEGKDIFSSDDFYHYTESGTDEEIVNYSYINDSGDTPEVIDESEDTSDIDLPTSWNSAEDLNSITSIKDQGLSGTCWAFSAIKAIESSAVTAGLADIDTVDYSESHLCWYAFHGILDDEDNPLYGDASTKFEEYRNMFEEEDPENEDNEAMAHMYASYIMGGNFFITISTLANWWGVADEDASPAFELTLDNYDDILDMTKKMMQATQEDDDTMRNLSSLHLNGARVYEADDITDIKQEIIKHGAAACSYCVGDLSNMRYDYDFDEESYRADMEAAGLYEDESETWDDDAWELHDEIYYNHLKVYSASVYNSTEEAPDHGVTIVGWDDNYSRDNFNEDDKPQSDGAWLVANSWGTGNGWTDDGYLWISYEDLSLSDITFFDMESTDRYDTNMAYDGYLPSEEYASDVDVSVENIFTNSEDSALKLGSVSFWSDFDGQDYTIEIYRNATPGDPDSGILVSDATTNGTIDYGYQVIDLASYVPIAKGETYIVKVTYHPTVETIEEDGSVNDYAYVFLEGAGGDELADDAGVPRYYSKPGQSYIKTQNASAWSDTTSLIYEDEDGEKEINLNNIPIKALLHTISDEEYDKMNPAPLDEDNFDKSADDLETETPDTKTVASTVSTALKVTPSKVKGLSYTAKKKSVAITWKKSQNAAKYRLQYSTKKSFKKKKNVTTKKTKVVLKKLKKKTKYYVRVRGISSLGTKGKWSKKLKVKTK